MVRPRLLLPLSLQPFQTPVIRPRLLLPLTLFQPFQAAVTSRLLIRQFNPQQLQFRRMVQLTASVPLSVQGTLILSIQFLMDLRGPGGLGSHRHFSAWRQRLSTIVTT